MAISYLSEERDARETEDLVAEAGRKAIILPGNIGEAKIAESVAWKARRRHGMQRRRSPRFFRSPICIVCRRPP